VFRAIDKTLGGLLERIGVVLTQMIPKNSFIQVQVVLAVASGTASAAFSRRAAPAGPLCEQPGRVVQAAGNNLGKFFNP
jgi:hypothetical protein